MRLRRFNQAGVSRVTDFVLALKANPNLDVPRGLLDEPGLTEPAVTDCAIDPNRQFPSRMDAAQYLFSLLEMADVDRDTGLWAWLTLLYFDQACPSRGGARAAKDPARYVPEVRNFQRVYRHCLLGPFLYYRAHRAAPRNAAAVLCGPIESHSEVAEQLASSYELAANPNVAALATELYFDPRSNAIKPGGSGKGPGSPRRLVRVLNQLDLTWDLWVMPPQVIMQRLPREFDRFANRRCAPAS